jgi:hypothetical protein
VVRLGIHRKCWSEFLCLGDYFAPPRQVWGGVPRGMRSDDTPPLAPRRRARGRNWFGSFPPNQLGAR